MKNGPTSNDLGFSGEFHPLPFPRNQFSRENSENYGSCHVRIRKKFQEEGTTSPNLILPSVFTGINLFSPVWIGSTNSGKMECREFHAFPRRIPFLLNVLTRALVFLYLIIVVVIILIGPSHSRLTHPVPRGERLGLIRDLQLTRFG